MNERCSPASVVRAIAGNLAHPIAGPAATDHVAGWRGRQRNDSGGSISRRMPMRYRGSICGIALATALLAAPAVAEVVDFGKYPDFKGQWIRAGGTPNNWIP